MEVPLKAQIQLLDSADIRGPDGATYSENYARGGNGAQVHQVPATLLKAGNKTEIFLKILPKRKLIAEITGHLVATALGLRTLEAWLVPTRHQIFFATAKVKIQTIKESGITYGAAYWDHGVAEEWFRIAFVFDTLVGNYDRVLRNMCFLDQAPGGLFVFMDHDKIFMMAHLDPTTLLEIKHEPGHNNLSRFLVRADVRTIKNIQKTAQDWQKRLTGETFNMLDQMRDLGLANDHELGAVKTFLSHRTRFLPGLVKKHLRKDGLPR